IYIMPHKHHLQNVFGLQKVPGIDPLDDLQRMPGTPLSQHTMNSAKIFHQTLKTKNCPEQPTPGCSFS
ncbi:hypothetical protein, partial [Bacillus marinisedimentorum]|uniref:hypothetical protein n=1 Tax=Bacillus marinisedimentorum TaxID=1821260 RepID=UPI001B806623